MVLTSSWRLISARRVRLAQGEEMGSFAANYPADVSVKREWTPFANLRNSTLGDLSYGMLFALEYMSQCCATSQHGSGEGILDRLKHAYLDCATYASLLRHCGNEKTLSDGKRIHDHLVKNELERNPYLGNLLLQMYGKCGCLDDAVALFAKMSQRDIFSWNFMIAAYVSHGVGNEAFQLFEEMQLERVTPDQFTFASLLSECGSQGALAEGKQIHAALEDMEVELDVAVETTLVDMYGKCGSLEDALKVFERMRMLNNASCSAMIAGYTQHGKHNDALQLFDWMQQSGVIADKVCFLTVLSNCASLAALAKGSQLHAQILMFGFESEISVGNALVNMYGKCGSLELARKLFDELPVRNVISWTTMMAVYNWHGKNKETLLLFEKMQKNGVIPNDISFFYIFDACANDAAMDEGKQVHSSIIAGGFGADRDAGTALINMYARCGSLEDAQEVFNKMPFRNVDSWIALIAAYTRLGDGRDVFKFYNQMQLEGVVPVRGVLVSVLTACASKQTLKKGTLLHATIAGSEFDVDVVVTNALVNMYGICGNLDDAERLVDRISDLNVVTWNLLISIYIQHGKGDDALRLFDQMHHKGGIPDKVTYINVLLAFSCPAALPGGKRMHASIVASGYISDLVLQNTIVSMYGKCGSWEDARYLFDHIQVRDIISWSAMIGSHVQHGMTEAALQAFDQMQQEAAIPDKVIFINVLGACTNQGALTTGRQVHISIIGSGCESDLRVGTALVNMYGKLGNLDAAWMIFEQIFGQDVISWTTIIGVYARNGQGKKALQLFDHLFQCGLSPNSITFLSILTACSHAGLLEDGLYFVNSMIQNHSISPDLEHYNCMIDLLGRAGMLEEAEALIKNMLVKPSVASWMTLLGACRHHPDAERGERAAKHVLKLNAEDVLPHIVLSNIYAASASDGDPAGVAYLPW